MKWLWVLIFGGGPRAICATCLYSVRHKKRLWCHNRRVNQRYWRLLGGWRDAITGRPRVLECDRWNGTGGCRYWEARWEGDTYVTPQGSRIETGPVPPEKRIRGAENDALDLHMPFREATEGSYRRGVGLECPPGGD